MNSPLKTLKIDRTKLMTPQNFAIKKGVHLSTVYRWIHDKKVKIETIDGVVFIVQE